MIIYISGGCKNGKSSLAEDLAVRLAHKSLAADGGNTDPGGNGNKADKPDASQSTPVNLYYIATMIPHDEEDEVRIARHIESRKGKGFTTLERGINIEKLPEDAVFNPLGTYLMDSVTALLSNEMFHDGTLDAEAPGRVAEGLKRLSQQTQNIIMVSDFIFSDQGLYDQWTETYQKGLALVDKTMAAVADTVVEVVLGQPVVYKGSLDL